MDQDGRVSCAPSNLTRYLPVAGGKTAGGADVTNRFGARSAPTALLEGRAVELSLSQIALIAPAASSSAGTWPTLSSSGALMRAIDVPAKGRGSAERLPRRAKAQ